MNFLKISGMRGFQKLLYQGKIIVPSHSKAFSHEVYPACSIPCLCEFLWVPYPVDCLCNPADLAGRDWCRWRLWWEVLKLYAEGMTAALLDTVFFWSSETQRRCYYTPYLCVSSGCAVRSVCESFCPVAGCGESHGGGRVIFPQLDCWLSRACTCAHVFCLFL